MFRVSSACLSRYHALRQDLDPKKARLTCKTLVNPQQDSVAYFLMFALEVLSFVRVHVSFDCPGMFDKS